MKTGSISVMSGKVPTGMSGSDAVTRNIQSQIMKAQKELIEIAQNKDMSLDEKMERRKELNELIMDLKNQLRNHQIQLRNEKQQLKKAAQKTEKENEQAVGNKANNRDNGLSQVNMQSMISADASVKQAKVQGSVASKAGGRAGVLKAEIKRDSALGGNVEAKRKELAETEKKATDANASQMETLAAGSKELSETAKAERSRDIKREDIKKEKEQEEAEKQERMSRKKDEDEREKLMRVDVRI